MEYLVVGIFNGALFAVLAGGLVLTYRVSKVLNFSAGALATASAYVYWQMTIEWGMSPSLSALLAVVAGMAVSGVAGVAIDRASRKYGRAEATAATAGLMLFLVAGSIWVWGAGSRAVPSPIPGADAKVLIGGIYVTFHRMATLVWGSAFAVLLHLWIRKTDVGLGLRAMSEDDEVAALHGVKPGVMALLAWSVAGLGSAFAGILVTHVTFLDPFSLTFQMVPAFVAAAVGVLVRFGRAYAGSIGLGMLYAILGGIPGGFFAKPGIREVIAYLLLAIALLRLSSKARPGEVM